MAEHTPASVRSATAAKSERPAATGRRRRSGPLVAWASVAGFLALLAALALQARSQADRPHRPVAQTLIVRRVYRTTIVEEVVPAGAPAPAAGSSVSTSSPTVSGAAPVASAGPVTRAS